MVQEITPQHFGNVSHTHRGPGWPDLAFCTASMLRRAARWRIGSEWFCRLHQSLSLRLTASAESVVPVSPDRQQTVGSLPLVFPLPWDPDDAARGTPPASSGWDGFPSRSRGQLAGHSFTGRQLVQQCRRDSQAIAARQRGSAQYDGS